MKPQSGPFSGAGGFSTADVQEIRNLDPDVDLDMFAAEPSHAPTAPAVSRRLASPHALTAAAPAAAGRAWRSSRLSAPLVSGLVALVSLAVIAGIWWVDAARLGGVQSASTPPPAPIAAAAGANGATTDHAVAGDALYPEPDAAIVATATPVESPPVAPPVPVAAPLAAGWLRVESPVDLDISSEGRVIGTSRADRTMLPAGKQALVFVNERVGYRKRQIVTVVPGETGTIRLPIPGGTLSVNAQPWAMVSIDGAPVAETPFANMAIAAGLHRLVFTHPQFGERRVETMVRSGEHVRLGVDLRVP